MRERERQDEAKLSNTDERDRQRERRKTEKQRERERRRVHRVLEYFESTRCIVTRAYPWSTLSTIRNQPRYTGGGSCTCSANGSLAELRAYTRCRIQIEHIDTTPLLCQKNFWSCQYICAPIPKKRREREREKPCVQHRKIPFSGYEFQTRSTSDRLRFQFRISGTNCIFT